MSLGWFSIELDQRRHVGRLRVHPRRHRERDEEHTDECAHQLAPNKKQRSFPLSVSIFSWSHVDVPMHAIATAARSPTCARVGRRTRPSRTGSPRASCQVESRRSRPCASRLATGVRCVGATIELAALGTLAAGAIGDVIAGAAGEQCQHEYASPALHLGRIITRYPTTDVFSPAMKKVVAVAGAIAVVLAIVFLIGRRNCGSDKHTTTTHSGSGAIGKTTSRGVPASQRKVEVPTLAVAAERQAAQDRRPRRVRRQAGRGRDRAARTRRG